MKRKIIDAHAHVAQFVGKNAQSYESIFADLLREAAQNGVTHLVIIAGFKIRDGENASTKRLLALSAGHDNVSIVGSIDVLHYKRAHLAELENWLRHKKIVAVKLYTGYQHFFPNDKRCRPIYELCQRCQVPVIFHSGDTLAGYVPDPKIKYSHPLHIDEVAVEYPGINFIVAHMGNPWLTDCAELLYKNPNVYADISGIVAGIELAGGYRKLMARRIHDLIDYAGADKLLYGSDWPLCPMKSYLTFVRDLKLPRKTEVSLLHGNAERIFRLDV